MQILQRVSLDPVRLAAIVALCGLSLLASSCGDDESSPLSPQEEALIGSWALDLDGIDAADLAFTYTFRSDHTVRNQIGGAFLRALRESEALEAADLGQLGDADQIDGATVTWSGTWSVAGDSLDARFTSLTIHAIGRLPVLGQVSVPVYHAELASDQHVEVTYAFEVSGDRLVLRGAAAGAGMATGAAESQTADLDPLARAALETAANALVDAYQQSDANEFTYLRQ